MNVASLRRRPIRSRVLAGSLLLAAIGAVAAAPAASAASAAPSAGAPAPGQISWSVDPASATAPDTRTVFNYHNIEPGSTIFDHVAVFNRSAQPVAFSIYATDATGTSTSGALTLLPGNARPTAIGAWTTFPEHGSQLSVIIPGGKGVIEPFTITVPRLATPGDHVGGMIAAIGVPHRSATGRLVTLYERIAVPIELRVTGKLVAALRVESVAVSFGNPFNPFGNGSAHVTYSVFNAGNVLLAGTQVVTVTGPFGAKSTITMRALPDILPGDSVSYRASAGGLYPAGSVTANVTVTPGWPKGATPLPVVLANASASSSLFAFPWALLVLVLVIAAGGYGWSRLARTRRRLHQAEIALAAEQARKETERRLLGGSNGKSGHKSAKPTAPTAPAASADRPAASAGKPGAGSTAKPAAGSTAKPAAGSTGRPDKPDASAAKPAKPAETVGPPVKPTEPAAKSAQPSGTTPVGSPNGASQPE